MLHQLPNDPLASLIPLLTHPLAFMPGKRFTQEHADVLDLDPFPTSNRGQSVNERYSLPRYPGSGKKTRVNTLKGAVKQVQF